MLRRLYLVKMAMLTPATNPPTHIISPNLKGRFATQISVKPASCLELHPLEMLQETKILPSNAPVSAMSLLIKRLYHLAT